MQVLEEQKFGSDFLKLLTIFDFVFRQFKFIIYTWLRKQLIILTFIKYTIKAWLTWKNVFSTLKISVLVFLRLTYWNKDSGEVKIPIFSKGHRTGSFLV